LRTTVEKGVGLVLLAKIGAEMAREQGLYGFGVAYLRQVAVLGLRRWDDFRTLATFRLRRV
jgi:hypothetical protein